MPKISMSFEKIRKHLLQITSKSGEKKVAARPSRFRNKEVPTFLRHLHEFEQKSKKTNAMIR